MALVKEMLGIQGYVGEISTRPNGDWLVEWLKAHKCNGLIKKRPANYQLTSADVETIRKRLDLPLSKGEKIFLQDLEEKENGRPVNKVGTPDRLIALNLIRKDGVRVVTTKYIADERIRYLLGLISS